MTNDASRDFPWRTYVMTTKTLKMTPKYINMNLAVKKTYPKQAKTFPAALLTLGFSVS